MIYLFLKNFLFNDLKDQKESITKLNWNHKYNFKKVFTVFYSIHGENVFKNPLPFEGYTGCPDQISGNFKIRLFNNQNTCIKYKDSFEIVQNMATKYVFS